MKFNKKIIVASLSTVLGLGIVGSITGTVAWYSYNTRVSSSIVGVSQVKSGTLQFSLWEKKVKGYTGRGGARKKEDGLNPSPYRIDRGNESCQPLSISLLPWIILSLYAVFPLRTDLEDIPGLPSKCP